MSLPGEQVSKSFIDALKDQPLSLALVAMNIGLLGFLYYGAVVSNKERLEEQKLIFENRNMVARLLAECHPGPRTENGDPRNELGRHDHVGLEAIQQ